mgnify:FL=1
MMGFSALGAGLVMEYDILSLRETVAVTAFIQILMGLIWLVLVTPSERSMTKLANTA